MENAIETITALVITFSLIFSRETVPNVLNLHSPEKVQMVNLKLMTIPELNYAIENGADGRNRLAKLYQDSEEASLSNLTRKSVI